MSIQTPQGGDSGSISDLIDYLYLAFVPSSFIKFTKDQHNWLREMEIKSRSVIMDYAVATGIELFRLWVYYSHIKGIFEYN